MDDINTGSRLKERRNELNISINELARMLGIAPSTILRYEKSDIKNMGIDKVADLAKALNCDPGYIAGWQNEIRKYTNSNLIKGFNQLDEVDQAKVQGFVGALLQDEKYKKSTSSKAM